MAIPGDLLTTAMGVMPHTDVERALDQALSMDIPFWPQLPRLSYHEDMYVQASEHFPGIVLDLEQQTLSFDSTRFIEELEAVLERFDEEAFFDVSEEYSAVYPRFLELDLAERSAIRGQMEGPVSFGFNVCDENDRPIIFDDTVRPFLLDFMARRVNAQLHRLQRLNPNAFMFVDEPVMQFIFSALSGYGDMAAREDLATFFAQIEHPRGIHLCGNPDWDFMLGLDLDVLSLDVYTNGERFVGSAAAIKRSIDRGGVIVWGIVPTNVEPFGQETVASLEARMVEMFDALTDRGIDRERLRAQSQLSPATCCLVNPDGEATVEQAFAMTRELADRLRGRQ